MATKRAGGPKKAKKGQAVTALSKAVPGQVAYEKVADGMVKVLGAEWALQPAGGAGDRLGWAVFVLENDLQTRADWQEAEPRWLQEWTTYFSTTGRRGRPGLPAFIEDFLAWTTLIAIEAKHKKSEIPHILATVIKLVTGGQVDPESLRRYVERNKLTSEEGLDRGRWAEARCRRDYPR